MSIHAQVKFSNAEHKALKMACAEHEISIGEFIKQAVIKALVSLGFAPQPEKEKNHE